MIIDEVEILGKGVGGIIIDDIKHPGKKLMISCAKITKVTDYNEMCGLIPEWGPESITETITGADGEEIRNRLSISKKNIYGRNYVLISRAYIDNKLSEELTILTIRNIVDLFQLPESDVEDLTRFLPRSLIQKGLELQYCTNTDPDDDDSGDYLTFHPRYDTDVLNAYNNGDDATLERLVNHLICDDRFKAELLGDNYIQMYMSVLIQMCEDRFNKLNKDDLLTEIANKLINMKQLRDGELMPVTINDINEAFSLIRGKIGVRTL